MGATNFIMSRFQENKGLLVGRNVGLSLVAFNFFFFGGGKGVLEVNF